MSEEKEFRSSRKRFHEILSVVRKYHLVKDFNAKNLCRACEDLGPCFVKLGQMAAMRSDLIPQEICDELVYLCSDVRPMAFAEVEEVLTDAYHKPLEEVFFSFEQEPCGSASLAQVHYAVLANGQKVAVKVQRPHILQSMLTDIATIESMAKRFSKNKLVEMLDLVNMVKIFKEATLEELDFLHEAHNILEYREKNKDVGYCQAPEVFLDLCCNTVLVMEYIEGPHIGDIEALKDERYDLQDLAAKYVKNLMKQALVDGLCHSDPHPANLKLRDGKLVWLDWGMAEHFTSSERALIRRFFLALSERDAAELTECLILLDGSDTIPDKPRLYAGIKRYLDKTATCEISNIDLGFVMKFLFELLRQNHIVLSSNYIMMLRSFATMQSLVAMLDPQADLAALMLDGITETIRETSDAKEELEEWLGQRRRNWKKIASIPVNLAEIIQNMSSNLSGVSIDINIPDGTKGFMAWMTRIMIQGLIAISLIISSAIVTVADLEPTVFGIPLLGFIGYCAAVIIGIHMIITFKRR